MDTANLKEIVLEGGPAARGRQHGEVLRPKIHELLDRWAESLQRVYGLSRQQYIERFFAETKFEEALHRHAPSVIEEVRGIAEGADVPYAVLLAFQHVNEEFWLALPPAQKPSGEACSTIALGKTAKQPTLIGQNLDLDQYLDGYQVLLRSRCDKSDGRILALSVPGMISLNGMNSHGFAICDNALTQLRADVTGVPIFALYRLLLESRSLDEAIDLITRLRHASGLNWVMGDPSRVVMIERSADVVARYGPTDTALPICHTNHPLRNTDTAPAFRRTPGGPITVRPTRSTYLRLASLHENLNGLGSALTIDAIKGILASRDDVDYPVSRGGGRNDEDQAIGFTLACCIFELASNAPRLHIAAGPPHRSEFRTFAA
jgi:hypothetical protein